MEKFKHFTLSDSNRDLDYEWVMLIQEAFTQGITKEEIKQFLQTYGDINHQKSH
jgi:hypothetical protein